jgi:hypothetical protein
MATKNKVRLSDRKELVVDIDKNTGDIVYLKDNVLDMTVIDQPPQWEMQVNRQPVQLSMLFHEDRRGILQTIGRMTHYTGYCQGWGLQVARLAVPGKHSLHLQYRVKRVPMERVYPVPGPSKLDVEMPMWVDTLGFLGWHFKGIKPGVRMRVFHLSGGGPPAHMSAEDDLMEKVNPHLWNLMRRTYPGVQSIPGALYYNPKTSQWIFILSRRSKLSYISDFTDTGMQFHMQYHKLMGPLEEFPVPEISIFWGNNLEEMEKMWVDQFDQYQEPPDWNYHTVWTAMGSAGPNPRKFSELAETSEECIKNGGANGFWLYTHDIKRFDTDTSPSSLGPCPNSGTYRDFREMVKRIHNAGGKVQVWLSSSGLKPWGDVKPEWEFRGIDGKHWISWGWDEHEFIVACNPLDKGYRNYMLEWTRRYVEDFDVDAFFLDCGVFTFPSDFAPNHTQNRFPSEAGPAMRELFYEMWDIIQEVKPNNFHMWYEGFHSDYPGTGYTHGSMVFPPPPPEVMTAQRMLYNFVKRGRRLVWGTLHAYDLACGYAQWNPPMGGTGSVEEAVMYAKKPMNRFIVNLVKERGIRDAIGITDGLSLLDRYLITIPEFKGRAFLTEPVFKDVTRLKNVITGKFTDIKDDKGIPTAELKGGTAYIIP